MAKNFYTAKEAAEALGTTEDGLKKLVQEGKLREFRDADSFNYKVSDIEALTSEQGGGDSKSADKAMASGEIVLEPVEDSTVELAPTGSDILSLEDMDADDTAAGTKGGTAATSAGSIGGSSAVPSVGINVFDDDELDEQVDPLAQTAVTDIAGLGLEGSGGGSGILDLTRESDDTSLGSELLEEIYTDEKEEEAPGEGTRVGLDEAPPDIEADEDVFAVTEKPAAPTGRVTAVEPTAYVPDALSSGLTALLVVAVIVMWFAGLGSFSAVRGVTPALLMWIYNNLAMCAGGAVLVGAIATGVTFFLAKRVK